MCIRDRWSDRAITHAVFDKMYALTDIALPSVEDELLVTGLSSEEDVVKRLTDFGIGEIVLKMGEKSCLVLNESVSEYVDTEEVSVVDTTSAGDSFNAGYIAARLRGQSAVASCAVGHRLASTVIQHKGAIIPATAMPNIEL